MKVLILGGGGREHAIGLAVSKSPDMEALFFTPGNAGTAAIGVNLEIAATDIDGVSGLCRKEHIDLVIVGPEQPLVLGMADHLRQNDVAVMGPSAGAARLEGSKSFAKDFMNRHAVPTARYRTFRSDNLDGALSYVDKEGAPIVVKASGLAGGKGAIVCNSVDDARMALRRLMEDCSLGDAGEEVVVESFMHGEEASVFVVTDGNNYVLLPSAQDHKQIGDGDTGVNTGGMGAYSPAPVLTMDVMRRVRAEIIEPTLRGMSDEGTPYQGILYCGLMITDAGPKVVEYNCRLGDPETQVVLPLLQSDALELFYRSATGTLSDYDLRIGPGAAACVVMASDGYPAKYETGRVISGIEVAQNQVQTTVFYAGVRSEGDELFTSGGRVLAVGSTGADLEEAIERAYSGCSQIHFDGAYYRTDIGRKGLARIQTT